METRWGWSVKGGRFCIQKHTSCVLHLPPKPLNKPPRRDTPREGVHHTLQLRILMMFLLVFMGSWLLIYVTTSTSTSTSSFSSWTRCYRNVTTVVLRTLHGLLVFDGFLMKWYRNVTVMFPRYYRNSWKWHANSGLER